MNARKYNIFVSVNAIASGRRSRTRDAIGAVRHVFLDADNDAASSPVPRRRTWGPAGPELHPSLVAESHTRVLARQGFDNDLVERLQKQLARELQTDPAATPVTQNTRLPGFFNHKRVEPHLVTIEYRNVESAMARRLSVGQGSHSWPESVGPRDSWNLDLPAVERAKRYLSSVPPAIAGQHGDVHTFRVCCRLTRGFALDDDQALHVLTDWNARCQPPWSLAELLDKLRRAARYGREPVGGLL